MFVATQRVRDELMMARDLRTYDDHCRKCQQVGSLMCCDDCPAVYHVQCTGLKEV